MGPYEVDSLHYYSTAVSDDVSAVIYDVHRALESEDYKLVDKFLQKEEPCTIPVFTVDQMDQALEQCRSEEKPVRKGACQTT